MSSIAKKMRRKAQVAERREGERARRKASLARHEERMAKEADEKARRAALTPEERAAEDRAHRERIGRSGYLSAGLAMAAAASLGAR